MGRVGMNLLKAVRVQDHHLIWFENPSYRVLQVSYISAKLVMWVLVRCSLTDQVNLLCTVGFLGGWGEVIYSCLQRQKWVSVRHNLCWLLRCRDRVTLTSEVCSLEWDYWLASFHDSRILPTFWLFQILVHSNEMSIKWF